MQIQKTEQWSEEVFGNCELGDPRRTKRLVRYGAHQAESPSTSTSAICADESQAEAAYRFLKNPHVKAASIDDGAFGATAKRCENKDILAIQDTTTVAFAHKALRKEFSENGSPTGFLVHSTLVLDAKTTVPIGLIDQSRWLRDRNREKPENIDTRPITEKESFKWQEATERMSSRLPDSCSVITICDREADIYEYLQFQIGNGNRFITRCSVDRKLSNGSKLFDLIAKFSKRAEREIEIEQRGSFEEFGKEREARPRRKVKLAICAGAVEMCCPKNKEVSGAQTLSLNAVVVKEEVSTLGGCATPLCWRLLTTEPIETAEDISRIVRYYESRWVIEEFHKCWKTGCSLEKRPLQSAASVENFISISAPIAIRILQLKFLSEAHPEESCEQILSPAEWECLHQIVSPEAKFPENPPTAQWVYKAIGKLGGFSNSKRTGRIGWQTLWKGWMRFQDRYSGWVLAMNYARRNL